MLNFFRIKKLSNPIHVGWVWVFSTQSWWVGFKKPLNPTKPDSCTLNIREMTTAYKDVYNNSVCVCVCVLFTNDYHALNVAQSIYTLKLWNCVFKIWFYNFKFLTKMGNYSLPLKLYLIYTYPLNYNNALSPP